MKTIQQMMCNESIISSTQAGNSYFYNQTLDFLKSNKVVVSGVKEKDGIINLLGITVFEMVPSYFKAHWIHCVHWKNAPITKETKFDFSDIIEVLCLENCEVEDLSFIPENTLAVVFCGCHVKSLKGCPKGKLEHINFGGVVDFPYSVKEIQRATGLKPGIGFNTIGTPREINLVCSETTYYLENQGTFELNVNDAKRVYKTLNKVGELVRKEIPEVKSIRTDNPDSYIGWSKVWITFDFLNKEQWPNGTAANSIFSRFSYDTKENTLENSSNGHLELTDVDRAGKYHYFALKSLIDPYLDKGGKKFRKTRIYDFQAKEIADKIIPWLKDVVNAALKDQGGELKRK